MGPTADDFSGGAVRRAAAAAAFTEACDLWLLCVGERKPKLWNDAARAGSPFNGPVVSPPPNPRKPPPLLPLRSFRSVAGLVSESAGIIIAASVEVVSGGSKFTEVR